jgi:hypothetical protein
MVLQRTLVFAIAKEPKDLQIYKEGTATQQFLMLTFPKGKTSPWVL